MSSFKGTVYNKWKWDEKGYKGSLYNLSYNALFLKLYVWYMFVNSIETSFPPTLGIHKSNANTVFICLMCGRNCLTF